MKKLLTLLLFMACLATAQTTTTYVLNPAPGQYNCSSFFRIPTSFYQFTCNINFVEEGGSGTGEMIGTNVLNFNPVGFGITGGTPYLSRKSKVLQDVAPTPSSPGQATWEWQVQTQDGMYHAGVLTMTWNNYSCGRGGCRVTITEVQTTVDSSTVAILDDDLNNPFRTPVITADFRWPSWLRWLFGASEPVEIYL